MGLGFIALLLIGAMLFYPLIRGESSGVRISVNTGAKKAPEPSIMQSPRFHGLDKDNQPYTLTADRALETVEDSVELEHPTGEIILKNAQKLSVKSEKGTFKKKDHLLLLKKDVIMDTSEGYHFETYSIEVDVAGNTATTADIVRGKGPMGTLKAYGGAMADGRNQQILFVGPVFMTLNMDQGSRSTQGKKP